MYYLDSSPQYIAIKNYFQKLHESSLELSCILKERGEDSKKHPNPHIHIC